MGHKDGASGALKVLCLEGSHKDFEIIRRLLIDAGYDLSIDLVETEGDFASSLHSRRYDVILADFKLPGFDAFGALRRAMQICPNAPFICISGSIGEETAIELIKQGAVDYVMKERLEKLPFVVRRAVREAEEKEARRRAEESLRQSETKYRSIFDNAAEGIYQSTPEGKFLTANPAMARILGFLSPEELTGGHTDIARQSYVHPEQREEFKRLMEQQGKVSGFEYEVQRKDGSVAWISETAQAVRDDKGRIVSYDGMIIDITDRKRTERDLLLSKLQWEDTFNAISDIVCVISPEHEFLAINDAGVRSLKLPREEIVGKKCFKLVHGTEGPLAVCPCKELLRPNDEGSSVYEQDGRYYSLHAWPIHDDSGEITAFVHIVKDITERKKAEEALRQSEQRYKTLLESINDYTYSVEIKNGRPVKTVHGSGCEKVTGFTPADYSSDPKLWIQMVHPDDRRTVEHYADPLCEGKKIPALEHRILHKNGSVIWVRNTYVLKHDAGGKVLGYHGLISDITERKQMENAIRKSEEAQRLFSERLTKTLEAINELSKSETFDDLCRNAVISAKRLMNFDRFGIWFFLPDHRTMRGSFGTNESGNLQDERSMRLPIVERHIQELVPSKKPIVLFEDEDLRDFRGNIVGKGSHVVAGLWNGEEIIGLLGADNLIRKHPILESDIRLLNLYSASLGHMFTLKRAEDRIRNDLGEKNVMLKEIHHRVRNNLNVITSLLNLQSDRIATKDEAMAAFEESRNRIYAMALVHSNLYQEEDFSRIDLTSFIHDLTRNLLQVYKKDVKIELHIDDLLLDLNHAVPCGLILNELVTNALKHAFQGKSRGLISIVFRLLKENRFELTIQDNGVGLRKDIRARKTKSLGLAIVNQLVDQIDGDLKITRGKGTRFQITFPVSKT